MREKAMVQVRKDRDAGERGEMFKVNRTTPGEWKGPGPLRMAWGLHWILQQVPHTPPLSTGGLHADPTSYPVQTAWLDASGYQAQLLEAALLQPQARKGVHLFHAGEGGSEGLGFWTLYIFKKGLTSGMALGQPLGDEFWALGIVCLIKCLGRPEALGQVLPFWS